MVLTKAKLDSLSQEELVKKLLKFSNIADQLKSLTKQFDNLLENMIFYIQSYWFQKTVTLYCNNTQHMRRDDALA